MWEKCIELQNEIVTMRRELHRIPELGTEIPETCGYVEKKMKEYGASVRRIGKSGGLLAELDTGRPGRITMFRADMDALPVREETGLPFASEYAGCMHACGHDAHTAMLLGTAKVLSEELDQFDGIFRFLFQSGEETAEGALLALKNGALEPKPDAVFGTHIGTIYGPDIPSGTVIAAPGCVMASMDKFRIRVKGIGSHGSAPEKGIDPILTGAEIVVGLQEILSREFAGTVTKVLTVGSFHAGNAFNVIPEEAVLEGTVRAVDDAVRQQILRRIREISENIAAAFRAKAEVELMSGAAPVMNDPGMAALAAEAAEEIAAQCGGKVITAVEDPTMVGEDFAYFLEQVPGAFLFLSSSDPEKHTDYPHHSSHFDVDEDVLWRGAAVFTAIAERLNKRASIQTSMKV